MTDAGGQCDELSMGGTKRTRLAPRLVTPFLAISTCLLAAAQQRPGGDGATYVNEQFAAYEELARIRGLVDRREFDRAAEACDTLVDRFGDALLHLPAPAGSRPNQPEIEALVGLPGVVFAEIEGGPPELLAAYRRRCEHAARQALARPATQPSQPWRVAMRYFPTSAAAAVIEQLADRRVEAGDFFAARRLYDLLAQRHPDRAARGRIWETKRALCGVCLGQRGEAERLVAAPEPTPPLQVDWAGRHQSPREFLRTALSAWSTQPATDDAPGAARSTLTAAPVAESVAAEARLWQTVLLPTRPPARDGAADEPAAESDDAVKRAFLSGQHLTMLPVAAGGLLLVSDRRRVWAVDPRAPDAPRWRYELEAEPDEAAERAWALQDEPPALHTLSAAGGRVYAHLDRSEPENADPPKPGASTLVCLDARSGEAVWRRDMDVLGGPFDECRLDGAPLVLDDTLVAVVRRRKPFGFEACLLAGFDARSGALLWSTHLGEAATGGYGYHRPTRTFPAAAGRRVFVHSNIGTFAAVDADDGRVAWLRRYSAGLGQRGGDGGFGRVAADVHPWQYAPTLLWRDRVVIAPLDADGVFVFDQADGSLLRRISPDTLRAPETLLGIVGDRLYALGAWVVCYDLAAQRVAWERPLPAGRLFGRGALAADAVFVPTDAALFRYPIVGGPPASYAWNAATAGNVLPLAEQIVVANSRSLAGLVEKSAAFVRLDRRLLEDKADPSPALALAELALETSEYDRALTAVDEAVRRGRGAARLLDDALKRRIYRICTRHAELLVTAAGAPADTPKSRLDVALRLLDRAAACAPDADAEVRYRLLRARVQSAAGTYAAAAATYQQILSDPGLSRRLIESDAHGTVAAGPLARQRIARLIAEQGRGVYAETERVASDRLRVASDEASLLSVAERYPNSRAAPRALAQRAALRLKAGDLDGAARDLRRAMTFGDQADGPAILRELAEVLQQANRATAARDCLARGIRMYPAARFLREGRSVGFAELRRALLDETESSQRGPLRFPLSRRYMREFPSAPTLLAPTLDRDADARSRAFLVFCDEHLELFDAANGRAVWRQSLKCVVKPALLAIDDTGAVMRSRGLGTALLATPLQLFAVDLDRGAQLWSVGSSPEVADLPGVDPERTAHFTVEALAAGRLFAANDQGELLAINPATGHVEWRITTVPKIGTRLAADGRWVAYAAWEDRRNVVVLLNAATGRVVHRLPLAAERALQRFAFTDAGSLLAVTTTTIHALDPDSGRMLWTTPLEGAALLTSLAVGCDGLYLSTDATKLSRFDLLTGAPRWSTPPLASPGNDAFRAAMRGDLILVATQSGLSAVDPASGVIAWESPGLRVTELLAAAEDNGDLLLIAEATADAPPPATPAAAAGARFVAMRLDAATGAPRPIASTASRPASSAALPLDGADAVLLCADALIVQTGHVVSGYRGASDDHAASRPLGATK